MAFLDNIGLNRLVGNIKNLVSTEIAKVNLFKNIKIGSTTLSASSNSDTFELVEGSNITIGVDEPTNKITISSTGGGSSYTHPTSSGNRHIPSGGSNGQILRWSADGEATWGDDNDTTYTLGSFGITATAQELNYTDGVTSNIQTQLNGKASTSVVTTSANGVMSSTDKAKLDNTNIAYGTCSTAAATANKVIAISGNTNWSLKVGSIIIVKFTVTNTASNVKLNVNNTGAKSIWYNSAVYTGNSNSVCGYANRYTTYMYDGTNWVWISSGADANTTYTPQALGFGYGTCATAEATTAKVVTLTGYSLVTNGYVSVKFTYAVPASSTLNINSKGAKAIYNRGSAIAANIIKAGDIATFIYNGSQYHLVSLDRDNNSDTKNTAGSTDSSSKLFLVGATSQAANPQTYSHNTAYVGTDGCLYSNNKKVSTIEYTTTEPSSNLNNGTVWIA